MSAPTDPVVPAGSAQPLDAHVLARTAEHLAQRYAGVFSADLVERMIFESYAALAHARATSTADPGHAGVPQVLFVGEHDTGRAQIAAALLAHHAGDTLTVRSAGLLPGTALEPHVVTVLAERGVSTEDLYPKPVTDDVVAAADRVITFGTLDGIPVPAGANHQDWDVVDVLEVGPAAVAAVIDELDDRIQALYEQIRAHPPVP